MLNPTMAPGEACLDLVKFSEGCKLTSYQDSVGRWTIGYGHTEDVHEGMTWTQAQCDAALLGDLSAAAGSVNALLNVPVTQDQFDALCDFTFNLGEGNLARSTLLRLLNDGEPRLAADQFLRWVYAGGHILPGLVKRRTAERDLFLYGALTAPRLQGAQIDKPE